MTVIPRDSSGLPTFSTRREGAIRNGHCYSGIVGSLVRDNARYAELRFDRAYRPPL